MAKKHKSAIQQMEDLYKNSEKIKRDYNKALERAKAEVEKLKAEIATGEEALHEMYKHYVLNIISLESYQTDQKALQDKKDILSVAEKKVHDINELMKEELLPIAEKAKGLSLEYRSELDALVNKKRIKMLELKRDYLQAVIEESADIIDTEFHSVWTNELDVLLGRKTYNHASDLNPENFLDKHSPFRMGAEISKDEIVEAYKNRKIPYKLLDALSE